MGKLRGRGRSQTDHQDAPTVGSHQDAPTGGSRRLVAALATPERLRVFAAVVLGARKPSVIGAQSGLDEAQVVAALARLQKAGLVHAGADGFAADARVLAEVARREAPPRETVDYGATDPAATAVLNAFLAQGRLVSMPAQRAKRRIVLEHIAMTFEPGRRYTEADVNIILAGFYDDTATVRRYLVDEQLLDRAGGLYWRIGGWVDVLD